MQNNLKNLFSIENRTKYFTHVVGTLCVISIIVFSLLLLGNKSLNDRRRSVERNKPNPFQEISLEAKGASVWDVVNQREIFSKNADQPLPLASLTKVMTALAANVSPNGKKDVEITEEDLLPEGDSNLVVGDIWKVSELRDFTLLTSSNDGAFALASMFGREDKFVESMNNLARRIGLLNSKFFNEHGLDREIDSGGPDMRAGGYGSAHDMTLLFEYTLKNYPEILEATRYKNLAFASAEKIYSADNTNVVIDQIPNLIASKTGYTELAQGNLVIAYDTGLNRPIIISVLGSTQEGRFTDTLKLLEASQKYIQNN